MLYTKITDIKAFGARQTLGTCIFSEEKNDQNPRGMLDSFVKCQTFGQYCLAKREYNELG